MVSFATVLCCILTLFVSLVLPLAVLVFMMVKYKKQGALSAWLLGAAGFFITQILIRLPILTVLQSQSWFLAFSQNHLFLYAFSLAFTAGLFELAGRFAVAGLMRKNLTFRRSLAAGLGHGGIEAMVLIGMTYVNNLIYIAMINSGAFDTVIAQTAAMGVDTASLELIRNQLLGTSPALFLLSGLERLLAMTAHTAMSMLVCYGVASKKPLPCLLLCLGIHTLIDLTAGISLLTDRLSQTAIYVIIYLILAAVAAVSLFLIRQLHRRWQDLPQKEVFHDPQE